LFRSFLFILLFLANHWALTGQEQRYSFTQPKMGSPLTIIFYASDSNLANKTATACFLLVDSLVNIYSDYIDSSELNRLCASAGSGKPFPLSPALYDILLLSHNSFVSSKGSFDISLGPVTRLWRKARKEKVFPPNSVVKEKLAICGFNNLVLDTVMHAAQLLKTGMQLDLGGIAQGYIAQKIADFLSSNQLHKALVNVSGDIVALDPPPGKEGWSLGINVPEQEEKLLENHLLISNRAVTTSGDVYQFFEHNGKRYSHIVDPRTGYGITTQKNVTVIANDGVLADWLTKACSILTISKAKKLANQLGAEVLIAQRKKNKIHLHITPGFKRFWKPEK
jgi:thiamine biosynthesis lipoprotein